MKGYIYLIENKINHKKYIGKTYRSKEIRWMEHLRQSRRTPDRSLCQAILEYGEDNFEITEIEYVENAEERESYWIEYFGTYYNGYNETLGGDGTATIDLISQDVVDKYLELKSIKDVAVYFDCCVEVISKICKDNGIEVPKGGDIHSKNWKSLEVHQWSLNGNYIQSFGTCTQAAKWLIENNYTVAKVKHVVSIISKVCRGSEGRKSGYGFVWKPCF